MPLSKLLLCCAPAIALADASMPVFGHKVPDTDAICAAVARAWELTATGTPATAHRLGDLNPETKYVLDTLGIQTPPMLGALEPKQKVAIVDTNNPEELPDDLSKASIHSIVDHHKLSGLTNSEPLEMDLRPLCSAGSILFARAKAAGFTPPKDVAGCMLSSILSDSLEFRSPTTTPVDKEYAAELAAIAGLDVHAHAEAMLNAKAQIDHLTPAELVMMDTKIFKIGGKKLRVSVLETTQPAAPLGKRAQLVEAQQKLKTEEKLDDVLLFIVDILKESATFVSSSESATKLVERAWAAKVNGDGNIILPGVLSRKKQIIPKLEEAASNSEL